MNHNDILLELRCAQMFLRDANELGLRQATLLLTEKVAALEQAFSKISSVSLPKRNGVAA